MVNRSKAKFGLRFCAFRVSVSCSGPRLTVTVAVGVDPPATLRQLRNFAWGVSLKVICFTSLANVGVTTAIKVKAANAEVSQRFIVFLHPFEIGRVRVVACCGSKQESLFWFKNRSKS